MIGFSPAPFLIVLFGRGGGNIVKRRSSTTTSATATSFGVTVMVVEFPFVVLCNFAGNGLPTGFFPLLARVGLTIFGDRLAGAAFLAATFLAAFTGAFLAAFFTIFLAGAFFAAFFADLAGAFLAAFFAAVFFGTDPPVSLKISKFTYFGTRKAQRLERCVHKHQLRRARIPHDSLTRRRRGHHLGACEKSRIHI
ncbi:unannotated protein [freshwater metagenome]|uniref:Unannotated protein n=1 Tax=freshwater metagenome TaxID=449393 RepID=A0A6J6UX58_9ZZZZ